MNQNICMFVWNHFTNDARVLRECTALAEEGYNVDLICIHDPKDKKMPMFEQRKSNFAIYRVKRYPVLLEFMQKIHRKSRHNKLIGLPFFLVWVGIMYLNPLIVSALTVLTLVLFKTKLKVIWVRSSIIIRMIARGFQKNYSFYHSNDLNTLPQGYICSKLRFRKKKLIYDSHEVQTSRTGYDSKAYGRSEKFFINKIDTMIVENNTRAKYNEEIYGFYPYVVHNYPFRQEGKQLRKAQLRETLNLPKDEKILLYQGGIQAGRGLEKLIKAVPHFKEGTLVLIGDGRIKPELEKLVETMDLHRRVKFLPKVPVEDLPNYTINAYIGFQVLNNINFNHYSASSNKLFEYMMAGVPVVACSFPEIKKVVEKESIGICIDSHDSLSIAKGVNLLLEDEAFRNQLSINSKVAKEKYNWDKEKNYFLSVYKELV
ncbi:glycosyl transferase [Oceanobacillus picturae]|uniref:Glycosyl transferase n=1 Tax=Oceanobacillus picturae TaxID=171693 RepID=A0A0U9H2D9_9BACI|nr:glycosyltransferase [Oceanobacillus picturae]GAQ16775.1 glycosyl transferase [Oceanobacillus picturae]